MIDVQGIDVVIVLLNLQQEIMICNLDLIYAVEIEHGFKERPIMFLTF
jgi:hypothetical protein